MPILQIMLIVVLIGLGLWAINTYVPMANPLKTILNVFVVICVCLWLLGIVFPGWYLGLSTYRVGGHR